MIKNNVHMPKVQQNLSRINAKNPQTNTSDSKC